MPTPTDLRQRLDALRWSQRQLADVLSVSESYVSQMLSGRAPVSEATIDALDAAVGAMLSVREASGAPLSSAEMI